MNIAIGAVLGFLAVVFGAYAEHGLHGQINEEQLQSLLTAVRYNQLYAIVIIAIGLTMAGREKLANMPILRWCCSTFIIGTILFIGSIYFSIIFNIASLTVLTPIGGMILMAAWLMLAWAGILLMRRSES